MICEECGLVWLRRAMYDYACPNCETPLASQLEAYPPLGGDRRGDIESDHTPPALDD